MCNASTQTSDLSDREDRRLRTPRLKRGSRGATLEGAVSISPKPRAACGRTLSPTSSAAPHAAGLAESGGLQPAWLMGAAALQGTGGAEELAEAPAAGDDPQSTGHIGRMAVSEDAGSSPRQPSAIAKGKEKDIEIQEGLRMARHASTETEQQFRLPSETGQSTVAGHQDACGPEAEGTARQSTEPEAASRQQEQEPLHAESAAVSSEPKKAQLPAEEPAFHYRQIRRAWEERFGPSRQSRAPLLRKRSLEGLGLSESTSGCSSASFPASGVPTPQLPGLSGLVGSTHAHAASAPSAIPIAASLNVLGRNEGASSADAAPPPTPVAPVPPAANQPVQHAPVHVNMPEACHVPVSDSTTAQPAAGDSVPNPEADQSLSGQVAEGRLLREQQLQLPPQRGLAPHDSESSETAAQLKLSEAPDTATPSASEESFEDPNQADDSTFVTSRATSLARTLTPEEFPPAEIPQSFAPVGPGLAMVTPLLPAQHSTALLL